MHVTGHIDGVLPLIDRMEQSFLHGVLVRTARRTIALAGFRLARLLVQLLLQLSLSSLKQLLHELLE